MGPLMGVGPLLNSRLFGTKVVCGSLSHVRADGCVSLLRQKFRVIYAFLLQIVPCFPHSWLCQFKVANWVLRVFALLNNWNCFEIHYYQLPWVNGHLSYYHGKKKSQNQFKFIFKYYKYSYNHLQISMVIFIIPSLLCITIDFWNTYSTLWSPSMMSR